MKKILAILMAALMATIIASCSGGVSQEEYDKVVSERDSLRAQLEQSGNTTVSTIKNNDDSSKNTSNVEGAFNEDEVIKQLEVETYEYTDSIKTPWVVLTVHNSSRYNLDVSIELSQKDKDGNLIGVNSQSMSAVDAGCDIALSYMCDEPYDSLEYKIEVEEEQYYDCVLSSLSYEVNAAKNKAIVSVTNNGKIDAEFVKFTALFFKSGKIVKSDTGYAIDKNNQLKAGKTEKSEVSCYDDFDDVKVYLSGRA